MLCVKPTNDESLKNEILKTAEIKGDNPDVLTAVENGSLVGYVVVDPVERVLMLPKLEIISCNSYDAPNQNDRELAEYLVRAAGNYAYNRLMTTLSCDNLDLKTILTPLKFKEIDNKLQLDIKVLFKKCENCSSKH